MNFHFGVSAKFFIAMGMLLMTSGVRALECGKAHSPVEIAVCSDNLLKGLEMNLSRIYFNDLKALKAKGDLALHDRVQSDQRNWIARREKECASGTTDEVKACVGKLLSERLGAIQTEGYGTDVVPVAGLKLGSELLTWGKSNDDLKTLTYKGRIILEAPFPDSEPPFTIRERWTSAETAAVLIEAGEAASLQCSTVHVVESRKPGTVVEHELGSICVGLKGPDTERNDEGFAFIQPATSTEPGKITQWRGRTGEIVTRQVAFHPAEGTTMLGLVSNKGAEEAEPLNNAEFFSAVLRLPPPARQRTLAALWEVANGCSDCSGSAQRELYGAVLDAVIVAYSGCGWSMYGAEINCGDSDALAVWDRASKQFYFATDLHREDGKHGDDHVMTVSPALKEWSAPALGRFETWRAGRPWTATTEAK